MQLPFPFSLAACVALLCAGCSPRVIAYPDTHVPVLLSRVDRIGVHTPREGRWIDYHHQHQDLSVSVSTSSYTAGSYTVTNTKTSAWASAGDQELAQRLEGRHDREVRLTKITAHNTTAVVGGAGLHDEAIKSHGTIVEVTP